MRGVGEKKVLTTQLFKNNTIKRKKKQIEIHDVVSARLYSTKTAKAAVTLGSRTADAEKWFAFL